ncbi:Amino acid permease family protein [Tritrichomonas foetus]|uniref:Amino acid permease family protein n=1 Tax=Tritrichomonas foetus TaxID=1144522 RepID=A0A1J4JJG1_9EUKA|nr:Amino acid permease family protein [Tritrichomonas foetus]|eukprot:OHS97388.1 Amino acid permease family protein [Tritrichomonas foetus]
METIVILYSPKTVFGSRMADIRIFSSIMSAIIGYLANFGFSIRLIMFFLIWLGVIMYFVGLIFPKYTKAEGLLSCSSERFQENWKFTNLDVYQIFYTFSIIFPGFGGILAGSNSSGQLKRPQVSIPLGSIVALCLGLIIFVTTSLTLTGCHPKSQLADTWSIPIQDSSFLTWFVFAAIAATSIAKGITGLGSGPMVLRAMAADGIIHKWFGEHSRVFGTVFSIAFCLYGDFNEVSSLSSMLFLSVFAFLNQGLFMAKYAKASSFRPHFKFYSPFVALITCILCVVSMFLINWAAAVIATSSAAIFYYYLKQKHVDAPWGSLSQSSAYNKGLIAALGLRKVPPHPKLYRPNIVLFIDSQPTEHQLAITFLDQMLHDKGMAVVARVFNKEASLSDVVKDRANCSIKTTRNNYHIFYETVVALNMREALRKVMLLTGLASLRPNVVFVEFDEKLREEQANFIIDVRDNQWPIMLVRKPNNIEDFGTIDCWLLSEDGGLTLLMASILSHKGRKLRVLTFARLDRDETIDEQGKTIRNILKRFRVRAEVVIVPLTDTHMPSHHSQMIWEQSLSGENIESDSECQDTTMHYMRIADAIRAHSSHSLVTVISLPKPVNSVHGTIYMRWLNLLSTIPSSVLFVRGNGTPALSWQV